MTLNQWLGCSQRRKLRLDTLQTAIDTAIKVDAGTGAYQVARDIFTDPEIFELEMKHVFEGNWIYLGSLRLGEEWARIRSPQERATPHKRCRSPRSIFNGRGNTMASCMALIRISP